MTDTEQKISWHVFLRHSVHAAAVEQRWQRSTEWITESKNWCKIVHEFHNHQTVGKRFAWQTNAWNSIKFWQWLKHHQQLQSVYDFVATTHWLISFNRDRRVTTRCDTNFCDLRNSFNDNLYNNNLNNNPVNTVIHSIIKDEYLALYWYISK